MKFNQEMQSNQGTGGRLGAAVGLLVGAVTGGTMLALFGSSLAIVAGVLAAFVIIFTAYGMFMGTLLDIDARERGVRPAMAQSKARRHNRIKTQPLTVTNLQ